MRTNRHSGAASVLLIWALSAPSYGQQPHVGHPFLQWLGSEAKVVVSTTAAPLEEAAARRLVQYAGLDPSNSLVKDSWIVANTASAGRYHLIVVGTVTENQLFLDHPSVWLRTREQPGGAFEVRGLFHFGVGDFIAPSIGVVESGRNPYNIEAEDHAAHQGIAFDTWRWMVRLTGRTPRGVVSAVDAFLEQRLLSGVVGVEEQPLGEPPFVLARSTITADPPADFAGVATQSCRFIGWHQIDALLLSGFVAVTQIEPEQMWRLVCRQKTRSTSKLSSPHRRNSVSEILLCRMPNSREAELAAQRLVGELGDPETESLGDIRLLYAARNGDNTYVGVRGRYVAVESFDNPEGRQLLINTLRAVP
jgi:hypothetical protein